jgi:acetyl esterase
MGGPPLHELSPVAARNRALPPELAGPEERVHRVEDRRVPGPDAPIPVRVYAPADGRRPGLVYFHGGGFVIGNLDMSDRTCRALANASGCVVVSVDYRLAPEHRFPAAVADALAVTSYVASHGEEFGIDARMLAVGGESAGGNLAAVTALRGREAGAPRLSFQLLVCPLVDFDDDSPSMQEFGDAHFLTREALEYFAGHYLASTADRGHPHASPLRADVAGLPPAFVITAECDPLRDQGEAYVERLQAAGVRVSHKRYEGMIHPFLSLAGIVDGGRAAINDAAAALRAELNAGASG